MHHSHKNDCHEIGWIAKSYLLIDILWISWFGIVALPLLFSGIFIYIIITFAFLFCGWCCLICCVEICHGPDYCIIDDVFDTHHWDRGQKCGIPAVGSVLFMAMINVIIFGTVQFWHTRDWNQSFEIAVFGGYCDETDWFAFYKWGEYPTDIQFLIISWVLF